MYGISLLYPKEPARVPEPFRADTWLGGRPPGDEKLFQGMKKGAVFLGAAGREGGAEGAGSLSEPRRGPFLSGFWGTPLKRAAGTVFAKNLSGELDYKRDRRSRDHVQAV